MAKPNNRDKFLVLLTSGLFIAFLVGIFVFMPPIRLTTANLPTIGHPEAPVQVVLFEDLMCEECQYFSNTVFPLLKEHYIDTNKITLSLIPIAFLPHSQEVSLTALCVFSQNQADFWLFLKDWFEYQPRAHIRPIMDQIVQKLPHIDNKTLHHCVQSGLFMPVLNNNMSHAEKWIQPEIEVPTLFINGARAPNFLYPTLEKMIDQALAKQEQKND
ncbi:MAG: DsbA family protein [Simkaniaceae bacterium]|nr:DsbA family protein [Simkaniaceae bacterium]MCF7853038.1 DsbA family protein [Simkaniaceae bacterium]